MSLLKQMQQELLQLEEHSNLRHLPKMTHDGREVIVNNKRMLNLSSNDYLGLASDRALHEEFLRTLTPDTFLPSSSSSRLLTGNFTVYEELEAELSHLFGTEGALGLQQRLSRQHRHSTRCQRCTHPDTCRQTCSRQLD